jgi:hypothetical protein
MRRITTRRRMISGMLTQPGMAVSVARFRAADE